MKYSDQFVDWLVDEGYTHCFFVAGGNVMHLLDSVRTRMTCVPFIHEVGAGIAAEYFNEVAPVGQGRAFALVTAGPGLTNIITAMAGAFLESRELLVVGGQVKSADLAEGEVRQRGIQEVDGIALASPVCVRTLQIREPQPEAVVRDAVRAASTGRPGPVLIEFCLDAQAASPTPVSTGQADLAMPSRQITPGVTAIVETLMNARRPVVLLGGGLSRDDAPELTAALGRLGLPLATTWNAADRVPYAASTYVGRPNTWGMRWSNVVIQQADAVLAVGTRLGLQQTGFNWRAFAPLARVVQVDIDERELAKGHPRVDAAVIGDAAAVLRDTVDALTVDSRLRGAQESWGDWMSFARQVRSTLPNIDPANVNADGYVDPYRLVELLSEELEGGDVIIPCSSGGAFTVMMQAFAQKAGQSIVTDKGLASMGYGLSGAIGASLAAPDRRTILVEGDGGFAQNLQEVGTLARQSTNLKIFLFANEGYASIRMTQRNYFGGAYLGCDVETGLGLPDWPTLFAAYGVPCRTLDPVHPFDADTRGAMRAPGPAAFVVPIDPEQTYFPKITSRVVPGGGMESNPLHRMSPDLAPELEALVLPYLQDSLPRPEEIR